MKSLSAVCREFSLEQKRFHHYLLVLPVTIFIEHKPHMGLFSESKEIPPVASVRIQCWAITLPE